MIKKPDDHDLDRENDALDQLVAKLPRKASPPPWIERQAVSHLRASGHLRRSSTSPFGSLRGWVAAAAAGVVLFGAGYMAGDLGGGDAVRADNRPSAVQIADPERLESVSKQFLVALYSARVESDSAGVRTEEIREIIRRALVANSIAVLQVDPGNPLGEEILRGLDRSETARAEAATANRRIQWY